VAINAALPLEVGYLIPPIVHNFNHKAGFMNPTAYQISAQHNWAMHG